VLVTSTTGGTVFSQISDAAMVYDGMASKVVAVFDAAIVVNDHDWVLGWWNVGAAKITGIRSVLNAGVQKFELLAESVGEGVYFTVLPAVGTFRLSMTFDGVGNFKVLVENSATGARDARTVAMTSHYQYRSIVMVTSDAGGDRLLTVKLRDLISED
jgi:hypothetical protein